MSRKRRKRRRGITPWKKTALKVCVFLLLLAAGIHLFRLWRASKFYDQMEASRWGSEQRSAQVSAFLPQEEAMKEPDIKELEYQINTTLAQDSIKLTADGPDARLWQDCYSGTGSLTLTAGSKSVTAEAVGTGGAFFTFHPLTMTTGSYYQSDSLMKDEILLDRETAWKLFGAFNVIGRTVRVQDQFLRIAGVFAKEEGSLYEKAGLAEYLVFVQYKTLVQYGNEGGAEESGTGTISRRPGTVPATATASDAPVEVEEDSGSDDQGGDSSSGSDSGDTNSGSGSGDSTSGSGSGDTTSGSGSGTSYSGSSDGIGSDGSSGDSANEGSPGTKDDDQKSENVGTANTSFKDTGKITTYEIVMPDPVEGYAASVLAKSLGEDSGAIVVDNTNRFGFRNLLKDLRDFALLGMRTESVRYPYWENAAIGWETIFAALLLAEGMLILMTVFLLLLMLIHWYRHKTWTLLSGFYHLQDAIYESQSRKRYPEYYRERDEEGTDGESPVKGNRSDQSAKSAPGTTPGGTDARDDRDGLREQTGPALLEQRERIPFEKIPENRKAVVNETTKEDDQPVHSSDSGSDPVSLWWQQRRKR